MSQNDSKFDATNQYGPVTSQSAVKRPSISYAHELIKKGANLNAKTLYEAVDNNNLQLIHLLLYYEADVNALTKNNQTPFLKALSSRNVNVSNLLINYYDGCLNKVLYFAVRCDNNLACRLIEMGANVNYVWSPNQNVLESTLLERNVTFGLFKLIWERFDYQIIMDGSKPFLIKFINGCYFTTNNWIDSLCLILNSPVGFKLARECDGCPGFFTNLFVSFYKRNVKLADRLRILYLSLSLSMTIELDELLVAYILFGFNEELEVLIYFVEYEKFNWANDYDLRAWMLSLILGMEDDFDCGIREMNLMKLQTQLGFFNRSYYRKLCLNIKFSEQMQLLPDFPSLVELSRAASRKFIREAFNVKKPYQFHDAVRGLNLPQYIKNVIRFKIPIYL